ncbi:MAG: hypothetical protein CVT64_11395 [Actinobacteria bacterium HGW-Actinobacteria-4]|nr:MAG: hypothetical protein CVT64_11395 [Actinobacteria bacterium HGW-Actinobacteria-4]
MLGTAGVVLLTLTLSGGDSGNAGSLARIDASVFTPLGPDESDMRALLGELSGIELTLDGKEVAVEVPAAAMCDQPECAIYAAASFVTYQDDVLAGRLIPQWQALFDPQCYFCEDTLVVSRAIEMDGVVATGALLTVVDAPVVFTEDFIADLFPFDRLVVEEDSDEPVLLSMIVRQSEASYTFEDGTTQEVEEVVVTLLMALQWDGAYWKVLTVAIT